MADESNERSERFRALLDGELDDDARAVLESEIAQSPEMTEDFERYRRVVELLRGLESADVPRRFEERVEGRIRRRSRGRYFSVESRLRFPYEAVVTTLLFGAMIALFVGAFSRPAPPVFPEAPVDASPTEALLDGHLRGAGFRDSGLRSVRDLLRASPDGLLSLRDVRVVGGGRFEVDVPSARAGELLRSVEGLSSLRVIGSEDRHPGVTTFVLEAITP